MSEPTLIQTAEAWQRIEDVAERAFGMIPPDGYIYLNQTIFPHKRHERWDAPTLEVAQRWCDETLARGQDATVGVSYNAYEARYFTEVWTTVERPNDPTQHTHNRSAARMHRRRARPDYPPQAAP